MKFIKKWWHSLKNDPKGIALIFTLGMLGLLMLMAFSFVNTSMLNGKIAKAGTDQTVAKILAETAVKRALATLSLVGEEYADSLCSHDETSNNAKTFDTLHHLETTTADGVQIFTWDPVAYDPDDTGAVHWQYIRANAGGANDTIIGRFAYKMIGAGGKLVPSACVETGHDEASATPEKRPGVNVSEINLSNLGSPINSYLSGFNTTAQGGQLSTTTWPDFETLFQKLGVLNTHKDEFRDLLQVAPPKDPEAYWIDANHDNKKEDSELYHRFNLARTDWDGLPVTVGDIMATGSSFSGANTSGIRWLEKWENKGDFGSALDRARQIAANLIDYCDNDSTATTDNPNAPTYTGNDLTPYLNELMIAADATIITTGTAGTNLKHTYAVNVAVTGETIDIYGGLGSGAPSISIDLVGTIIVKTTRSSGTIDIDSLPTTISITPTATGYMKGTLVTSVNRGVATSGSVAPHIDIVINITGMKLSYKGNFADFAYLPGGSYTFSKGSSFGTTKICDFELKQDPRHNLQASLWKRTTAGGITETIGSVNSSINAASISNASFNATTNTRDFENGVADPASDGTTASLSTAYIRNGPMKSPWELGLIHRAANWQTINLKRYNGSAKGGNIYKDGDANILDHIKMTSNTSVYGKVNVNTNHQEVFKALFYNIGLNGGANNGVAYLDDPGYNSGTIIDGTTIGALLLPAITVGGRLHRAEIVNAITDPTVFNAGGATHSLEDTDAASEEFIGKFINLTKADTVDEIQLLVIAQSIKDVGTKNAPGSTVFVDFNEDGDFGDTLADAVSASVTTDPTKNYWYKSGNTAHIDTGQSEEFTGCRLGQYDIGADEITGEQKLLLTLIKSTSGSWVIRRYEVLEN